MNFPDKPYRGYIFDCDGTLADTMPLHLRAWNHGLRVAKAPLQLDGKAFMSVAGMAFRQTVNYWNEIHTLKIDENIVVPERDAYFAKHQEEVTPIEEVVAFAKACKESGAAVSVASGGTRSDVHKTLKIVGLEDFFPVIVTATDVERGKPAPDLFILAAKKMGIPHEDCLVIEDSPLGVEAANICGMDSVLVPHNMH